MRYRTLSVLAAAALVAACESPLEIDPTASIGDDVALSTPRGVELGVTGAYRSFQTGALYDREVTVYPEMFADNLDFTGTYQTDREMQERTVTPDNVALLNMWEDSYEGINRANNVLAAIPGVDLSPAAADRYRGETLFIRALHHFNLVRYFGGVPIMTEPSRGIGPDALVSRATQAAVYDQIIDDLVDAAALLPATRQIGRASETAAQALLAKVYLETGNWTGARDMATAVIGSLLYSLPDDYRSVFTTKNSAESIFELQYSVNNSNALAYWYFPQSEGGRRGQAPSPDLIAAFEAGDERYPAQVAYDGTTQYGIKYWRIQTNDDNVIVLRLAEMYLVRAEANARLEADPAIVRADIDMVRVRANLAPLPNTVTAEADLISAILQERRVELAMEGHRMFDLRRTGRAESVLGVPAFRLIFPIPQAELDVNENLNQNPQY